MKNLLSRDEYLTLNEGFGDIVKKGFNKLKGLFSLMIKKVKNFIVVFDKEGNVLPVVTPQTVIDNASSSQSVNVYASKEMSDSVVGAGGKGCDSTAKEIDNGSDYDYMKEDSVEYKNFLSLTKYIKENYGVDNLDELNERISYSKPGEKLNICQLNSEKFKNKLTNLITKKNSAPKKSKFRPSGYEKRDTNTNLLIFGAPGIGKSAIPNAVIKAYNEGKSAQDSVTLITINCATLGSDGFMMPTIPMKRDILGFVNRNKETIPSLGVIDDIPEDELNMALRDQKDAQLAPPQWLPCYHRTGDEKINKVLDTVANGGVWAPDSSRPDETIETGSGGIILLDELFRADPAIFNQLMTFLLEKKIDKWQLGSKWTILACSNRPADSKIVSEVWEATAEAAISDRFAEMWILVPDPEGWKQYMRKQGLTHENEILFKFIFDPDSMDGDEYSRWHRADSKMDFEADASMGNEKSKAETLPITPRRWETMWDRLVEYMDDNDLNSVIEIPVEDLGDIAAGVFTPDFKQEFVDWIVAHTGNVDINDVIKDPTNTYPSKNKHTDDVVIVKDIWEQFEKKFGKKKDFDEDVLVNIMIWLGMHFYEQGNIVDSEFIQPLASFCDKDLIEYKKFNAVIAAAFPSKDDYEGDSFYNQEIIKDNIDKIKSMMKEYFPWRLKGDEIQFIDDYEEE